MPEAILKFQLPEENAEFHSAINAPKLESALYELDQRLRSAIKYGCDPSWDIPTTEKIRELLWEIVQENHATIDT
jgi:hypothetical protein